MLEIIATVVALEEDFSQPISHTLKLCNVKAISGDQCAGENRHILLLSLEESQRLATIVPQGYMAGNRDFLYSVTYGNRKEGNEEGALLCSSKIPAITRDDEDLEIDGTLYHFICDGIGRPTAEKLAKLLGGELMEDEPEEPLPELVLEGDWMEAGYIPRNDIEGNWKKVKDRDIIFRAYLTPGKKVQCIDDAVEMKNDLLRQGASSVRIEIVDEPETPLEPYTS